MVLVASTSVYLLRFVRLALRLSLWNDEIFSVVISSSQGAWVVVTEYQSNNHVFFNLVNALTPGADSVDPARARLWSIVALFTLLGVGCVELWRRGWFLVGAAFFAAFAANPGWLDLVLQARGYGFLGLAALVCCVATWRHLESGGTRSLVVLGAATVLGTWTVPSFVLFGAPLWLALLVATRSVRVLIGGVVTAVAMAVVFLPIIGQVWKEASQYEEIYGRSYIGLGSVADTLRTYLLGSSLLRLDRLPVAVAVSVPLVVAVVAVLAPVAPVTRRLVLVVNGSVVAFFAANVAMETAVVRTTAFVVVPVAFTAAVVAGDLIDGLRPRMPRWSRVSVLATAAVVVAVGSLRVVGPLRPIYYVPIQNWAAAGEHVERTFPEGTGLAATRDWLGVLRGSHVGDRYPDDGDQTTSTGLSSGRSLLFDSSVSGAPSFDFSTVAPVWSEARFPQRQGEYLRVLAAPPEVALVAEVSAAGRRLDLTRLTDRRVSSVSLPAGAGLGVVPAPALPARSLTVVAGAPLPGVSTVVVRTPAGREVISGGGYLRSGTTLTVYLGDRRVDSVEVTFAPGSDPVELREVWVYPISLGAADG